MFQDSACYIQYVIEIGNKPPKSMSIGDSLNLLKKINNINYYIYTII